MLWWKADMENTKKKVTAGKKIINIECLTGRNWVQTNDDIEEWLHLYDYGFMVIRSTSPTLLTKLEVQEKTLRQRTGGTRPSVVKWNFGHPSEAEKRKTIASYNILSDVQKRQQQSQEQMSVDGQIQMDTLDSDQTCHNIRCSLHNHHGQKNSW